MKKAHFTIVTLTVAAVFAACSLKPKMNDDFVQKARYAVLTIESDGALDTSTANAINEAKSRAVVPAEHGVADALLGLLQDKATPYALAEELKRVAVQASIGVISDARPARDVLDTELRFWKDPRTAIVLEGIEQEHMGCLTALNISLDKRKEINLSACSGKKALKLTDYLKDWVAADKGAQAKARSEAEAKRVAEAAAARAASEAGLWRREHQLYLSAKARKQQLFESCWHYAGKPAYEIPSDCARIRGKTLDQILAELDAIYSRSPEVFLSPYVEQLGPTQ